tara:strand:- start:176 stop:664 length:489 start_codon:yes stop_codon:yes gene_type:complete
MEKRLRRIEIGIILVFVMNIVIISNQFMQKSDKSVQPISQESKVLPQEFNNTVQDRVLQEIKDSYNQKDYDKFYEVFSEWAQLQIPIETVESQFDKLIKVTGEIKDYVFSNYEHTGLDEGADWYLVYYKTKFENGIGTTKLTLRVIGANWEIVGINITLDEI